MSWSYSQPYCHNQWQDTGVGYFWFSCVWYKIYNDGGIIGYWQEWYYMASNGTAVRFYYVDT